MDSNSHVSDSAEGIGNRLDDLVAYFEGLDEPKGYRWPASRLTHGNMRRLYRLKQLTRQPITALLREAVELLCGLNEIELAELGLGPIEGNGSSDCPRNYAPVDRTQLEIVFEEEP